MQENEFEKDMRQKMDAWQLHPAEEVWQKIKEEVAQKRKRRRGIIFFLLAGLIAVGVLFTALTGIVNKGHIDELSQNKTNTATDNNQESKSKKEVINSDDVVFENRQVQEDDKAEDMKQAKESLNVINGTGKSSVSVSKADVAIVSAGKEDKIMKPSVVKRKTKSALKTKITVANPGESIEENLTDDTLSLQANNENKNPVVESENNEEKEEIRNEIIVKANDNDLSKNEIKPVIEDKNGEKQESKPAKSKWGAGFSIAGGKSYAGYNNNDKSLVYTYNDATSSPGQGNNPATGTVTYNPSEASASFGFSAALHLFRPISKKVKFITGLQYQLFSTSQKTGTMTSGATQSFAGREKRFAYGTQNTYSNYYHYLTLPVGVSANLFDVGSKEIHVEADISFSRMIKTNALLFDTAGGYYYNQSTAFNKNFIGLSAFLSVNLAGKNKPALYIGPQFYYSITALAPAGMYGYTHSRFIGLRLQKNLTK